VKHHQEPKFNSEDFSELLKKLETAKPSELNSIINENDLDDFEKEAIEGALFYSDSKSFSSSHQTIQTQIEQQINKGNAGKRNTIIWFSAAASFVFVIAISVFMFNKEKQESQSISLLEEQTNGNLKDKMIVSEPDAAMPLKEQVLIEKTKYEQPKNTKSVGLLNDEMVPQNQEKKYNLIAGTANTEQENSKLSESKKDDKNFELAVTETMSNDDEKIAISSTASGSAINQSVTDNDMSVRAESVSVFNTKKSKSAKEKSNKDTYPLTMPAQANQVDKEETDSKMIQINYFSDSMYKGGMTQLVKDCKAELNEVSINNLPEFIKLKVYITTKNKLIINSIEYLPLSTKIDKSELSKAISKLSNWIYQKEYDNQIIEINLDLKN
jgi:hypothetical protein